MATLKLLLLFAGVLVGLDHHRRIGRRGAVARGGFDPRKGGLDPIQGSQDHTLFHDPVANAQWRQYKRLP